MKLLSIDIENSPHLVYTYNLWGNNMYIAPDMVVERSRILCFAAKWIGEGTEPMFFSEYHNGRPNMLSEFWNLLNEADALVHFNGNRFDETKINKELLVQGYDPPSPFKHIDLYTVVKKNFDFAYKRLDQVAAELGLGRKVKHSGISLWKRCLAGDPEAWEKMREYNVQDVVLNEELFDVLKPWISTLPSVGAAEGKDVCPACGNVNLTKEGFALTKTGKYQRYRCNSCGTWLKSSRRVAGTKIVQETR